MNQHTFLKIKSITRSIWKQLCIFPANNGCYKIRLLCIHVWSLQLSLAAYVYNLFQRILNNQVVSHWSDICVAFAECRLFSDFYDKWHLQFLPENQVHRPITLWTNLRTLNTFHYEITLNVKPYNKNYKNNDVPSWTNRTNENNLGLLFLIYLCWFLWLILIT